MIQPIERMEGAFSVNGLNVIVTGGSQGIGFGISSAFAEAGANVAVISRGESSRDAVKRLSEKSNGKHFAFTCDVADLNDVRRTVAQIRKQYGQIDVLVNNAGISRITEFLGMDETLSAWHDIMATDLNGTAYMTYEVAKGMCKDALSRGSIINISSVGGHRVESGAPMCAYSTAKAGIDHFTRVMSVELGKYNITVNAIAPGFIQTKLADDLPTEVRESIIKRMPLGRYGQPMEIGALAVFLASPAAAHITGDVIILDGGFGRSN